jgi:hypothetical protein
VPERHWIYQIINKYEELWMMDQNGRVRIRSIKWIISRWALLAPMRPNAFFDGVILLKEEFYGVVE